jgi:hypothetical protein
MLPELDELSENERLAIWWSGLPTPNRLCELVIKTGSHVSKVVSEKGVLIGSLSAEEGGSEYLGELGFDDISFGGNVSGGNTKELPGRGMIFLRSSACWTTGRLERRGEG